MVFSSPYFLFVFLPFVLLFSFLFKNLLKVQNIVLLLASLFFYSWGSFSHLLILVISILINYIFGLIISKTSEKISKVSLLIGVAINIGVLFYFKYLTFFIDNINHALGFFTTQTISTTKIVLPIGISFFTFQALSYIVDVFNKKVKAQKNFLHVAFYISFFPQLIAGPIVRYSDIVNQIYIREITLEKTVFGIQRFIWGLAKKVLIANSLGYVADKIFEIPAIQISTPLSWLGIICYTFQIFFDFSGYSDMAIGLAKVFGFDFHENFNLPYSANSIRNFWRRWHISLSEWFRDYLYIPLGGSKKSAFRTNINLLIVFICTGFWHGASWNFMVWGLIHGAFILLERNGLQSALNFFPKFIAVIYTFIIVVIAWVFFRVENVTEAFNYVSCMFGVHHKTELVIAGINQFINNKIIFVLFLAGVYSFGLFDWIKNRAKQLFLSGRYSYSAFTYTVLKHSFVLFVFVITLLYMAAGTYNPFIYFRF